MIFLFLSGIILAFTKGQGYFALFFFIAFLIGIIFAYRKDKRVNATMFKGSYKILLFALFIFIALFLVVKMKHYFFH
jgi:hypothetical protein